MKIVLSGRAISLILVIVLLATTLNTILVISVYNKVNDVGQTDSSGFEYVVTQSGSTIQVRNTLTKEITSGFASAAIAINYALSQGNTIYLKGTFDLTADIVIFNTWNAKLVGDNAIINANGYSIIVRGGDYTKSKYNLISGLTLNNGTLRVGNTFGVTVSNMIFQDCIVGLEFANDNTWTEFSKIDNCHFINCTEGIAFRTPKDFATGSYESTEINRCFFNQHDNSIAINVETKAELSCSQLQNVRIWIGEYGDTNQTGLRLAGTMSQTSLSVVFESFSDTPDRFFGIDITQTAITTPILDADVSFLGYWTAKINNPYDRWSYAPGIAFSQKNISVPIGLNGKYGSQLTISQAPLKITSFKPKIEVNGNFKQGETITVRVKLEYIDNSYSNEIVKVFTGNSIIWFSDDELLEMSPSQNIVWSVIVDAVSSSDSTNVTVKISGYGIAG
ncbi:MAG: hypothetical protein FWH37_05550 [Candidatus Bathyarchaeota archaeon]|nr:hypothetical protein [Candidatus Termiticorpusculum sp.]